MVGQLVSYRLLTYRKLPEIFNQISLVALALLGVAFVLFTFYPPHLPLFRDPITGEYGITKHLHSTWTLSSARVNLRCAHDNPVTELRTQLGGLEIMVENWLDTRWLKHMPATKNNSIARATMWRLQIYSLCHSWRLARTWCFLSLCISIPQCSTYPCWIEFHFGNCYAWLRTY